MTFILVCIIIFLLYIILFKNKDNNSCDSILTSVAPVRINIPYFSKPLEKYIVPYNYLSLCKSSIEEIESSPLKKIENPISAITICKKLQSPDITKKEAENFLNILKTILNDSVLTSRYLLEFRMLIS